MKIAGVCALISDVNVNEKPHPQVVVMEFTADEEVEAKWADIVRLEARRRKTSPGNKPLDLCGLSHDAHSEKL